MTSKDIQHSVDKALISGFASACFIDIKDYRDGIFFLIICILILVKVIVNDFKTNTGKSNEIKDVSN